MLNLPIQNIHNEGKTIYIFNRYGDKLTIMKEETFSPYFYELSPVGIYHTIDGKKVKKVNVANPYAISKRKTDTAYEADVHFTKRYLIDKVGAITKSQTKYFFIDIEVKAKEMPDYHNPIHTITCISLYNSLYKSVQTWFLNDYEGDGGQREDKLLTDFVQYISLEKPDIISGWNFINFDYAYLDARLQSLWSVSLAEAISPISKTRYGFEDILFPAGISVLDYLDLFKKIYTREVSYALDNISQKYLNTKPNTKVDFNQVSEEIKEKNIEDVKKMVALEDLKNIIPYYDEIRIMGKCTWEDLTWYSKVLDVMLLTEAKQMGIVLPSKTYGESFEGEIEFEGAYRRADLGRFENLWKLDLAGAYPNAISNFCLDISNLSETGLKVEITDRVTNEVKTFFNFKQNPNALLPVMARKLLNKKDILKRQLKPLDPESAEAKDLQIKYDATKALVNSLFGVTALKVFRLYDIRIASSITSLVRDLLHYIEDKLKENNMEVTYIDTDSVFIKAEKNPTDLLNQWVKDWGKEKYNKDSVGIEFDCEGIYQKLLVVALCHYVGYLQKMDGKVKKEIKGVEIKRKDSSKFMKVFQETLIDKILDNEPHEAIIKFIVSQKEAIKSFPLVDISFPCKINKNKSYKSPPIPIRALEYTKELLPFEVASGDTVYYIYVKSFGEAERTSRRILTNKETGVKESRTSTNMVSKNVLLITEDCHAHAQDVDWKKMIDRNIIKKCAHIFDALGWDIKEIK